MPTKSEEKKPVIQHLDDARGRVDTDALFASTHKGDPAERDRRVLRKMTFVASMGLAMVLAAMFTTILKLPDSWRTYGWRFGRPEGQSARFSLFHSAIDDRSRIDRSGNSGGSLVGNQAAQSKEGGLILDGQSNSSSNRATVETSR